LIFCIGHHRDLIEHIMQAKQHRKAGTVNRYLATIPHQPANSDGTGWLGVLRNGVALRPSGEWSVACRRQHRSRTG
jgi:hypothetical protein